MSYLRKKLSVMTFYGWGGGYHHTIYYFAHEDYIIVNMDSNKKRKDSESQTVAKPNFELSGKLAAETNTFNGVVLKYYEPPEAKLPTKKWRLYVFKGDQQIGMMSQ